MYWGRYLLTRTALYHISAQNTIENQKERVFRLRGVPSLSTFATMLRLSGDYQATIDYQGYRLSGNFPTIGRLSTLRPSATLAALATFGRLSAICAGACVGASVETSRGSTFGAVFSSPVAAAPSRTCCGGRSDGAGCRFLLFWDVLTAFLQLVVSLIGYRVPCAVRLVRGK